MTGRPGTLVPGPLPGYTRSRAIWLRAHGGPILSFIAVLVTIGPIETAVVFADLTAGMHRNERISLVPALSRSPQSCYSYSL